MAIVQFALRDKTRLGALRIRGDVLVLQALLWADEVREASFPSLETTIRISAQEREMSAALVDSMAADFEPDQFTDDYQLQLRQLIEAKLEKGESLDTEETFGVPAAEAGSGEVIDLMEALKRSLEKKRGGGAASGDGLRQVHRQVHRQIHASPPPGLPRSRRRPRPHPRRPPGPLPKPRHEDRARRPPARRQPRRLPPRRLPMGRARKEA